MSFFSKLFGTDSASFWRGRAELLETKLERSEVLREQERERHRIREEFLLDETLKAAGSKAIRAAAETVADVNGFEAEFQREQKKKLTAEAQKAEAAERDAFVEDSVRQGVAREDAEKYFDAHKTQILAQTY